MSIESDSRAEHLAWCKQRALAYLNEGDLVNALASMGSDLRKHPETDTQAYAQLIGMMGPSYVINKDTAGMRRFIEGFN
jgi:hypothetical protein